MKKIIEYILTKVFERFDYYTIKDYCEEVIAVAHINTISDGQGRKIITLINKAYIEERSNLVNANAIVDEINTMVSTTFPELTRLNSLLRMRRVIKQN